MRAGKRFLGHNAPMAGDTVQQVKDRLSVVDVVSQYVKLERSGQSMRGRCPFHAEKTPSFFVSPERGTYHCFGCGEGGDIFTFVEKIEGIDFKGALKILAEKAGVELVYEKKGERDDRERLFELLEAATIFYSSRLTDDARAYLKSRGVEDGTIHAFRLGWAGESWSEASDHLRKKGFSENDIVLGGLAKKGDRGLIDKFRNRIIFPIADSAGRVIGFSGRIFGENASPEAPKYLNSPETPLFHKSRILYGFDRAKIAIRKHNFAVLVEGQMDLILSHQAGWANTVAVSGTAFTPEHARLVKRMSDNLVLALDADQAGIKAAGRAARAALQGGLNVKVAQLPSGLDPADLIVKEGVEAWRAAIKGSKDIITFLLDVLQEHAKAPDAFRRSVESIVLPFVGDMQSPIEREQQIAQIAKRLGVSAAAVTDAFERVPLAPAPAAAAQEPAPPKSAPEAAPRVRLAYAILIWQQKALAPSIDIAAYEAELTAAAGDDALASLCALSDMEHEALRYTAEQHASRSSNIRHEAEALLVAIREERLRADLTAVSQELKRAEAEGRESDVPALMERMQLLTGEIARLHKTR